ncbi:hypothetical protein [Vibrio ezurae]|uniref:Uncharacterized protein n=1 Tax=Vibrio ezurae NBRC 102218 TaxID=1219080 RepID=U3CT72_9VIBR|nr:hypothetical protein [Vibrio ezurae]GAD80863.1 hypothetical protein VEZ01S_44_00660 [Vibrio ezurae NBRC 102218]
MSFKIKSLVLVGVSALILNGCDADSVDHVQDKLEVALKNAGEELSNIEIEKVLEKKFHLTHSDAVFVAKHHHDQAKYVSEKHDPIFANVAFNFTSTSVPKGWETKLETPTPWTDAAQNNVRRMLGQIAFILNTKEFESRFNTAGLERMSDSAFHSGYRDAGVIPSDYTAFKYVVNDRIQNWGDHPTYQLSAFDKITSNSGHFDSTQSEPNIYVSLHAMEQTSDLHQNSAQLLRELTRTVGYSHDGVNDLTPNNIPYYVQAIASQGGMNTTSCDILMDSGKVQNGVWASNCNTDATNTDVATQTLNADIFSRFFGN